MIKNNKKINTELTSTIIGNGINLEAAVITGAESVRIDGNYKGDVEINGNLVIGETGVLTGNIRVKYLFASGKIEGNIKCSTVVHIASTAFVEGNIEANSIIIDDGAQFNGNCRMLKSKKDDAKISENVPKTNAVLN